jgi:hypothetical protein
MKTPVLALAIALSAASLSFGQPAASDRKPQDETVQAIATLEHEWAAALVKGGGLDACLEGREARTPGRRNGAPVPRRTGSSGISRPAG